MHRHRQTQLDKKNGTILFQEKCKNGHLFTFGDLINVWLNFQKIRSADWIYRTRQSACVNVGRYRAFYWHLEYLWLAHIPHKTAHLAADASFRRIAHSPLSPSLCVPLDLYL